MFTAVQDFTLSQLPSKRKNVQSGWISFNAVCCQHNGHSQDTRGRGGVKTNPDGGISYHCFNCQFKTGYNPGRPLSFKYRKFLKWLGTDQNEIQRLVLEALRVKEIVGPVEVTSTEEKIEFDPRSLPDDAKSFLNLAEFYGKGTEECPVEFANAINYVYDRKINLEKYDFYWTPEVEHKLSHRIIIPFYYNNQIVGYTARACNNDIKPKYYSDHPANFVFNLNQQKKENKFVIVCEGPFDAMAVDGVAVLSNDISETQAELIEALGVKVIVVPDFDKHINKQGKTAWPGKQLVHRAIEYGWSVSFPIWWEQAKDISEASVKFGKLFTIKSILNDCESNQIKIKLLLKKHEQRI